MILLDTNIVSTFCKIKRIDLIFKSLAQKVLYVSPLVLEELKRAEDRGYLFIAPAFRYLEQNKIEVISPSQEEILMRMSMPNSFGAGEQDSLAICKSRNAVFVTNETKVINYCKREKIMYLDLADILLALHNFCGYTEEEVLKIVDEIEDKDNIVFRNKHSLFE